MLQLNAKIMGQGPALIVLHGLFGSLDNWITLGRQWSERFSVYLLDQRNHGRSPHHEAWDYRVMAQDLADFMDQQGIPQAHLLGHSMGGKTVMQFALDHPERVARLVVADMAPKAYRPHHEAIIEALGGVDLSRVASRQEVDQALQASIAEASIRQFLLKGLGRNEQKELAWKFNLPVIARDYAKVLADVEGELPFEGPALFIYGGKSTYLQPEDQPAIRERFPAAEFVALPQAGHWLHAEAPEAFSTEVMRFLEG